MADLKNVLTFTTAAVSGLFAGSCIFITGVIFPAIRNIKNTENARFCWKVLCQRGAYMQGVLMTIVAIGSATLNFMEESDKGFVWIVASLLITSIFPWSLFVMLPGYKILFDDDVVKKEGAEAVRRRLETWNKQQAVRTCLGVFVFGLILCQ